MKPILVFDIVETILNLSALEPVFDAIFGDRRMVRTWFDELIVYMEALTLTGAYIDGGKVGVAVLEMLARTHRIALAPERLAAFWEASVSLPPYPDVPGGLLTLKNAGYRMVTLSNMPAAGCEWQLQQAGIFASFERIFNVHDELRRFKPAPEAYKAVARVLGVPPGDLMVVSCHALDILGAASAGLRSALVLRPGNAPISLGPQPNVVVSDIPSLARPLAATAKDSG